MNWPPLRPDTWAWRWRVRDIPEHVLMSEIEIIADGGRRRRWAAAEKLRIVEETLDERASISVVARRNGVAPNLLVSLATPPARRGECRRVRGR